MTKFKIQESETARIKVFADYVRKLGAVYPLNDKQTFELEGTKLNNYAEGKTAQGGNGVAQIAIDVEDVTVDTSISAHFVTSINSLIVLLNKVKKGKVVISYDDKQLVVSEDGGRGKFKLTLFITCDQDELDETKNFISDQMATPEFQSPLKVDVKANYRRFANLSTMTRVLTISDVIESKIDGSAIKFADNLIILKYSDGQNTGVPEVFIEEKMLQLLKDVDEMVMSSDKKYIYFEVPKYGIKIIYVPKLPKWAYPTDQEVETIAPEADTSYVFEVNAAKFYDIIEKFRGVFQQQFWRYEQVRVFTKDVATTNELRLHFDDMASEIEEYLPVKVVNNGSEDDFNFLLPCIYFEAMKDDFVKDENSVIQIIYNGLETTEPHGAAVILKNDNLHVTIAKLNE